MILIVAEAMALSGYVGLGADALLCLGKISLMRCAGSFSRCGIYLDIDAHQLVS